MGGQLVVWRSVSGDFEVGLQWECQTRFSWINPSGGGSWVPEDELLRLAGQKERLKRERPVPQLLRGEEGNPIFIIHHPRSGILSAQFSFNADNSL